MRTIVSPARFPNPSPGLLPDAPPAALLAERDRLQAEMEARRVVMDAAYWLGRKDAMDEAERARWAAYYRWLDAVEAVGLATPRDAAADEMPTCTDPSTRGATR